MDALRMLEEDHVKVKKILATLDETTERAAKTREELFAKLKTELTIHETIEEEILYPTLKEFKQAEDIVLEGYEEHHVADLLVGEISTLSYDDETWGAKLSVLKEGIEHHIEEEEGDMFKKARKVFDETQLSAIGDKMEARKKELQAQAAAAS